MRVFPRLRLWRGLRYRLCVMGVCLAYLLVALEIPLPVFVHKDSSQPFPCQDHACGCQSAEQCWRSCCCFTAEERWAWARAHDVQPPAYAEKPAERPAAQGWNTVKKRFHSLSGGRQPPESCVSRGADAPRSAGLAKSCCGAEAKHAACCQPAADQSAKSSPPKSDRFRWITTMAAWRCQGYSTLWVSAGAVLLVPPLAAWTPDWTPPARLRLPSVRADKIPAIPPDPPPRLFLA